MSSSDEKIPDFIVYLFLFLAYVLPGILVGIVMGLMGEIPMDEDKFDDGDFATIVFLWPLFVIKYLVMGIWFIVTNGYDMLLS